MTSSVTILRKLGVFGLLAAAGLVRGAVPPATGTRGMVSSAHPAATRAGLEILEKGGNAFDAAVAVAAALNVVEPAMSGMGGYGTILIYDAGKNRILYLNPSGRIPAAVNSDLFRAPTPGYLENRAGPKAVSTPGNVHAWEAMSVKYGRLPWKSLFGPAIRLAEEGFEAFQKDLARSLRAVAEGGAKAFYEGEIGRAIAEEMKRTGGFLSLQDLRDDRAEWFDPIHIIYRGVEVYTAAPPANSFCSLIRLGIMSRFDVAALGHNTTDTLHRFIEASKHAFWCRLRYSGDPDVAPPPFKTLLAEPYWKEQAGLIDPRKAQPFQYPGLEESPAKHTTHFVVADADGNIVSATQTLGNAFGSRILVPGTGIWLNNSLAYCTFEPKGNPMDAHAGRRKLSGDCPTILIKDGKPWAALGTPGGHTIGQTVPQMVMNLIDFKMDIAAALAAPRVSFIEPDEIAVESGIDPVVIARLKSFGHKIRVLREGALGNAQGLTIIYGPNGKPVRFSGASDPRGSGLAQGCGSSLDK